MFALNISAAIRDSLGANHLVYDFRSTYEGKSVEGRVTFKKESGFHGVIRDELVSQHIEQAVTFAQKEAAESQEGGMLQATKDFQARMAAMLSAVPGLTFESFHKLH